MKKKLELLMRLKCSSFLLMYLLSSLNCPAFHPIDSVEMMIQRRETERERDGESEKRTNELLNENSFIEKSLKQWLKCQIKCVDSMRFLCLD